MNNFSWLTILIVFLLVSLISLNYFKREPAEWETCKESLLVQVLQNKCTK